MTIRKKGARRPGKGGGRGKGRGRGDGKGGGAGGDKGGGGYGKLPPSGSQRISLADAVDLTQRFRKASPPAEHGGFFWANGIQEILAQPGCVGLRYYHGLSADGHYRIVLVGVDGNGNDITTLSASRKPARSTSTVAAAAAVAAAPVGGGGDAVLLEHHWPCPPFCTDGSPLL